MDATDRKILSILQEDAALSIAEVASRVNLSQTPCWRRIQKMDEAGIIQRRVALVDPEALGLGLTVFVEIETGDHSKDWLERFAGAVASMPEVMGFYRMAGDVDYLLQVTVANMAAFDAILSAPDRVGAAEERYLAFRHGAGEVYHCLSRNGRIGVA